MPDEVLEAMVERGARLRLVDTGAIRGVTHDVDTPRDQLPQYDGPLPLDEAPDWGAAAAEHDDASPLEGPALAPYGQAADPEV